MRIYDADREVDGRESRSRALTNGGSPRATGGNKDARGATTVVAAAATVEQGRLLKGIRIVGRGDRKSIPRDAELRRVSRGSVGREIYRSKERATSRNSRRRE